MGGGDAENEGLGVALGSIYLLLMLASLLQLGRIVYYRHRLASFQCAFLAAAFVWLALRVVFWFAASPSWPLWITDLVYVLPTVCQCATFGLLVLYLAKLLDKRRFRARTDVLLSGYAMANLVMLAMTVLFAGMQQNARAGNSRTAQQSKRYLERIFYVSSAVYFGLLTIVAAYYVRMIRRARSHAATIRSSTRFVTVTAAVFVVVLSRCVFDIVMAVGGVWSVHVYYVNSGHRKRLSPAAFCLFILWEVVPTLMVLVYFRHIPRTNVRICRSARRFCSQLCGFGGGGGGGADVAGDESGRGGGGGAGGAAGRGLAVNRRRRNHSRGPLSSASGALLADDGAGGGAGGRLSSSDDESSSGDEGNVSPVAGRVKVYRTLEDERAVMAATIRAGESGSYQSLPQRYQQRRSVSASSSAPADAVDAGSWGVP